MKAYLKFLWQSTNQHGVHSPYVFQLITKCFYDRKAHPAYQDLKAQRRSLLLCPDELEGNHIRKETTESRGGKRQISEIPKASVFSSERSQLLNRLIRYLQVNRALVLGSTLGLEAAAMATHNSLIVTSFYNSPYAAKLARKNFENWGLKEEVVQVLEVCDISECVESEEIQQQDLVYIGRSYWQENAIHNFIDLLPLAHNDSVFIFDGIHSSTQMEKVWATIKEHPEIRVSIDTFRWGFIFFRKEQVKEHFIIRL